MIVRGRANPDYRPNDELYTPSYIFEKLGLEFDIDVCGPVGGLSWIPAKRTFSRLDNGLIQQWQGRVWMNPPFSAPNDWVMKWLDHKNGVMLAPLSKSNWFIRVWESEAAVMPLQVKHRFMKPDLTRYSIAYPTALWAIGETNITALKMSGLGVIR